ncbi:MAG: ABC transporter permease, partial [Gemmatimonadaceae bacterium]
MKLVEVFRYELAHRFRSPSTAVYAIVLLWAAWASATEVGPVDLVSANANAPARIAFDFGVMGMIGLIVTAWIFGDAALRDFDAGMDPLLFTSSQRRIDHLGGRYLAAFVANAILLLTVPVGYALPVLMGYPDPAYFGPFRIEAYLLPWSILLLPNLALTGAVMFAAAVLSRRLVAVYLTGMALFLFLGATSEAHSALDPGGLGIMYQIRDQWTPAERNERLVGLSGKLLWNRLFWLGVTGGVLALLHKCFRFAHPDFGGALSARQDGSDSMRVAVAPVAQVATSFGFRTAVQQTLAVARNSLVEVTINPWFVGVLVACIIWVSFVLSGIPGGPLDLTLPPVTMLVTSALSRDFLVMLYVLLGVFASEIVWKDREVGVAEISDAAPVADGIALLGRFLAIVGVLAILLATSVVAGMVGQLGRDYYDLEPSLYLRVVFGMNLAAGVLIAALVLMVGVVVNHKYLGVGAALLALGIPFAGPFLPHYLLTYGGDPGSAYQGVVSSGAHYSYMNGFGPFLTPFALFKLYSAGLALLLAVIASVLWVRGLETGFAQRLRQARERFTPSLRRTTVVGLALTVTVGAFILYNTNVLNSLDANEQLTASRADYAEGHRRIADVPQPSVEY